MSVREYQDRTWTGCSLNETPVEGQPCATIIQSTLGGGWDIRENDVHLTAIVWGDDWIALACGNYLIRDEGDYDAPVPAIEARKFDDLDRDGIRDAGEPWISGWEFRLVQEASVDPHWGLSAPVIGTTDANGLVRFEFDGQLSPGTYRVEEVGQAGWAQTAPSSGTVVVEMPEGEGEITVDAGLFGNARNTVDVAKTAFEVSLPDSFEARTETPITVDVEITNNGPADFVPIRDEVFIVAKPEDCVLNEEEQSTSAVLRIGETVSRTFSFLVTCDLPSDHVFTFGDRLLVTDDRLTETNTANNEATTTGATEVHAFTSLSTTVDVDCPDRTYITDTFTCAVTTTASNDGYGPIEVEMTTSIASEIDCVVPDPIGRTTTIADGETASFTDDVEIVCANRSFHAVSALSAITAVDVHVFDANSPLERAAASAGPSQDIIEVFERTDLSVFDVDMFLVCSEYWQDDPFECTGEVTWSNDGPADNVNTLLTATLTADGCIATPDPQVEPAMIAAGGSASAVLQWQVTCADADELHVLSFEACVENDPDLDPHAEDVDPSNDCATVVALPIDFKPLSDPNSVNLRRGGVTSVAILSTGTFDPFAVIDTSSLFFGPTGTEAAVVRCSSQGEDANADGYDQDMTCKFRNRDLGLAIGDEIVCLTGRLIDGTRFIACDTVRVI